MRRKTLIIGGAIVLLGLASLLLLKSYQLELIESVIVNALIQKAPPEMESEILQSIPEIRAAAVADGRKDEYLKRLVELSQRLEKVQQLDRADVEGMLSALSRLARLEETDVSQ